MRSEGADMDFREALKSGRFILFDGGMGTMLQERGLAAGEIPENWNTERPDDILAVHKAYVDAGSDVITTNTFGANSRKFGAPVAPVIDAAIRIARRSGAKYVAQDIGPTGAMLRPLGDFEFDDAYALFKEQVEAGVASGADLFIIETMTDLLEAKCAVLAVKENSDLPVVVSLSYEKNGRTFLGVSAAAAAVTLSGMGVDALGVNCSVGPDDLAEVVETLCCYSEVPVIIQANAGLPSVVNGRTVYSIGPKEFTKSVSGLLSKGRTDGACVQILGGCCGTTPDFIRELDALTKSVDGNRLLGRNFAATDEVSGGELKSVKALVCSSSTVIEYDCKTAVIGERINPTGKKKISAALRAGDYDLITTEAERECECGAEILDVNAGLADIDESAVLRELVIELTGACRAPLQLDTTDPAALESAIRVYAGKPIINSVNGKEENMKDILPIAAKYGAALICLTLNEEGIPQKAADRIGIGRRIIEKAAEYGIPKKNIIIDGLVMTVSTNQREARETLETVRLARTELGVHTCLGVSNISFGLPEREVMNSVFLAEAFANGLNLPIIDPTKARYMQTVYSHRVLDCEDESAVGYIDYSMKYPASAAVPVQNSTVQNAPQTGEANTPAAPREQKTIADIVVSGNKGLIEAKTAELLMSRDAMDIINNEFIPALDKVGELYEAGRIFLPQLMNSAETAKKGFEVIKKSSAQNDGSKRMSIVLATVKGDIHDIGKNIVKMLLENYGFDVIDLGKDVDPQVIVDKVKEENIKLVGLSALMTTTVHNMEDTIKLLKKECPEAKIMVGGAVLSELLAQKIGADYYSKDAAGSAKIAAEVEESLN